MKIRNLGNDAYTGDSPPEFWRMPCLFIANAKKQSGKTALITSALHRLKEAGCMDVIIAISDTFDSNLKMMKNLNIKREHVFSPNDPEAVKKVINIIEAERDDLQRYRDELERYKELDKHLENASIWDDESRSMLLGNSCKRPTRRRFDSILAVTNRKVRKINPNIARSASSMV